MTRRRPRASCYTDEDRRADNAARYGTTPTEKPIGGFLAHHDGECDRCHGPIVRLVSNIIRHHGGYIHAACASGADE